MKNRNYIITAITAAIFSTTSIAEDVTLEEIIVTAQKRAENLQEIPVSVSALTASNLENLKLRSSTEVAAQVPNMQVITPFGNGFATVPMRGISMSDTSLNQNGPIARYVDEVYKGNPAIQGVQLFDLELIEVLRCPQGTSYGKIRPVLVLPGLLG